MKNKNTDMRKLLNEFKLGIGGIVETPPLGLTTAMRLTKEDQDSEGTEEKNKIDESLGGYIRSIFNNLKESTKNIPELDPTILSELLKKIEELENYYTTKLSDSGLMHF